MIWTKFTGYYALLAKAKAAPEYEAIPFLKTSHFTAQSANEKLW
jgi:hypothetical protein